MAIEVEIDDIKKTLPELLIIILSKEYPLRIKELHSKLKEKYRVNVSFQAVRKALNLMVHQGKLLLEKSEYSINKEWAKDIKKLSDTLIDAYFTSESRENPPKISNIGGQMEVFHFENSLQTDKFLGELLFEISEQPGKKTLCIQALHFWYYLGHFGTESDFIQEMVRRKSDLYYVSFGGRNLLDEMADIFYNQHGCNYKIIDDNLERYTELIAMQNIVIRVQYPKEFVDKMDKLFKETKDIKKMNFQEFGNLIKSKFPIILTLFKDESIAKSIIEKTKSYY